jgi:hypothetical protein
VCESRKWGRIEAVLTEIEDFCILFGIEFCEINGRKVVAIARPPIVTHDDVRACLENINEFIQNELDKKAKVIQRMKGCS